MIIKIQEDLDFFFDNVSIASVEGAVFAWIDSDEELRFEADNKDKRTEVDSENARLLISDTSRENIQKDERFECRLLYITFENKEVTEILTDGEIEICNNYGVILEKYCNIIIRKKDIEITEKSEVLEETESVDQLSIDQPNKDMQAPPNIIQTEGVPYSKILSPNASKTEEKEEE